jgi:hypothetical protein
MATSHRSDRETSAFRRDHPVTLESPAKCAYSLAMDDTPHHAVPRPDEADRELAPFDAPLHVSVAPGSLDRDHTVDREPGESDARYQSRCDLWTAVLDYAKRS